MIIPLKGSTSMVSRFAALLQPATLAVSLALVVSGLLVWSASAEEAKSKAQAQTTPLDRVERTIVKEPKYRSLPRYALLILGAPAKAKVWLVEDGKTLYIDKNGNGDLTDDGPPVTPTHQRRLGQSPPSWDFDYCLDEIALPDGARHTKFRLARWNYGAQDDSYGLSLTLNAETPMYAGWTPFWAATPEEAPLIHFGGTLQPRLLRSKEFVVGSGPRRLSICFINPGLGQGAHSRLSIEALPATVIPSVDIDWPVAEGAPPLRTSHLLVNRCCYWEFYDVNFKVPPTAVPGSATVTVSLPDGAVPLDVRMDPITFPVRAMADD